jgi:hypothetical protein
MTTTYRAAYIADSVLTGPEHADLSDAAVRAEAMKEARRAGLLDETTDDAEAAFPPLTRDGFEAALCIGNWTA